MLQSPASLLHIEAGLFFFLEIKRQKTSRKDRPTEKMKR
jgi:hypothetical protein